MPIAFRALFPDIALAGRATGLIAHYSIRNEQDYRRWSNSRSAPADHLNGKENEPLTDLHAIVGPGSGSWKAQERDAASKAEPRARCCGICSKRARAAAKRSDGHRIADGGERYLAGRRAISKKVAKALAQRFQTDVSAFL